MAPIAPPALVLVTGATGFLATHLNKVLLEKGYRVRGTVRSAAKGERLRALYNNAPGFSYVVVPDIGAPGAYDAPGVLDEEVQGIAHLASPIEVLGEDANPPAAEWLKPAVDGTLSILKAAGKFPSVKNVIVVGTLASVIDFRLPTVEMTSATWNEHSPALLEQNGDNADWWTKYCASKVLSEKAAWKFWNENRATLPYDLTYLLPSTIFGPILLKYDSPDSLVFSLKTLYNVFAKPVTDEESLKKCYYTTTDVRDIARAHIDVFTRAELSGKRHILAEAKNPSWQDIYDTYWALPESRRVKFPNDVPRGKPGVSDDVKKTYPWFVTAEKDFGWNLIPLSDSLADSLQSFKDTGLL